VYGLSVFLHARQWKKIAAWLEKDHFAFLPMAMMSLVFGLVLVNAYNIWDWNVFTIITLTGWSLILKSMFYFLAPGSWTKSVLRWRVLAHVGYYHFAGAVVATLGGYLSYCSYFAE
jgi:uncharacterized protein YjeT (DUF2065 family)